MNGHKILNIIPKPKFLISGVYNLTKNLLPVNCRLVKVVLYMVNVLTPSPAVNIKVQHSNVNQTVNGSRDHIQSYDFNLRIPEETPLFVKLFTDAKVTSCFLNLYFEET